VTRDELATQLEELAGIVAGWAPIVPPAVATGRVAARLSALAWEVAAGGTESEPVPAISVIPLQRAGQ
jgi:hypothetical protein